MPSAWRTCCGPGSSILRMTRQGASRRVQPGLPGKKGEGVGPQGGRGPGGPAGPAGAGGRERLPARRSSGPSCPPRPCPRAPREKHRRFKNGNVLPCFSWHSLSIKAVSFLWFYIRGNSVGPINRFPRLLANPAPRTDPPAGLPGLVGHSPLCRRATGAAGAWGYLEVHSLL